MTITQTGIFRHGTYGFPVDFTLSTTPISLSAATAISLTVKRPGETDPGIVAALAVPGAIIDPVLGIIRWVPANGDLTVAGTYTAVLSIAFGVGTLLTVDGKMKVA